MEKDNQRQDNLTVSEISIRTQIQPGNDVRPQITQHVGRLRLPEISDDDKIESLIQLIILSVSFAEGEQNGIVATSGVVETVSGLMLTLCGAVIEVIQQRGCETGEQTDWRTLLSPIVSLLFNSDEKISEIGKQSLLKAIVQNAEILHGLLQLGIFDEASDLLNLTFPSQQTAQQQSSQQQSILPQQVLLNILEVVEKIIRQSEESIKKTDKLKKSAERIKQLKPPRQIKSILNSILSILEDEQEQDEIIQRERLIQEELQQAHEQVRLAQEQVRTAEQAKIKTEERVAAVEGQIQNKDAEINRLQQIIDQSHVISGYDASWSGGSHKVYFHGGQDHKAHVHSCERCNIHFQGGQDNKVHFQGGIGSKVHFQGGTDLKLHFQGPENCKMHFQGGKNYEITLQGSERNVTIHGRPEQVLFTQ
ncbi:MAG: hypothetical protein EZS28_029179 [Streblomastix strix]|uniref:Uncharacterized protein n=1 Tax=Streblomastix strix TaxID=222440 RepID=A0A5J4UX54_9EUKA|nr:MAG: hypothetical protein EZS28_029179 [Streblomastix strix]